MAFIIVYSSSSRTRCFDCKMSCTGLTVIRHQQNITVNMLGSKILAFSVYILYFLNLRTFSELIVCDNEKIEVLRGVDCCYSELLITGFCTFLLTFKCENNIKKL